MKLLEFSKQWFAFLCNIFGFKIISTQDNCLGRKEPPMLNNAAYSKYVKIKF